MKNNSIGCLGWTVIVFGLLFIFGLIINYWYIALIVIGCILFYFGKKDNKNAQKDTNHTENQTMSKDYTALNKAKLEKENSITSTKPVNTVKTAITTTNNTDDSSDSQNEKPESQIETFYLEQNFSIGDLLFLNWLNGREKNQVAPASFTYQFSINPLTETDKLASDKLITNGSLEMRLSKLKVVDLKNILRSNNQKVSGRKIELMQRIIETINSNTYIDSLPEVYELSDKGRKLVNKYQLLVWASKNDRLLPTKNYIPYINSDLLPEEIAIKLTTKKLIKQIHANNKYDAYVYGQCENSLASLYLGLEDYNNYVQHSINSFLLDYFLIMESYSDIYIQPRDYNTIYLQTALIKVSQTAELSSQIIASSISEFVAFYKSVLPNYVINSKERMEKIINDALRLTPESYHAERINFLSKYINMQKLV